MVAVCEEKPHEYLFSPLCVLDEELKDEMDSKEWSSKYRKEVFHTQQAALNDTARSKVAMQLKAAAEDGSVNQFSTQDMQNPHMEDCDTSQERGGADNKMGESELERLLGISTECEMDWARPREEFVEIPDATPFNALAESHAISEHAVRMGLPVITSEHAWLRSRETEVKSHHPSEVPGEQSSFEAKTPILSQKPRIKGKSLTVDDMVWRRTREKYEAEPDVAVEEVSRVQKLRGHLVISIVHRRPVCKSEIGRQRMGII